MKTKIQISDFSEETIQLYISVCSLEEPISTFIEELIASDFPKEDIKEFIKVKFPTLAKGYIKLYNL